MVLPFIVFPTALVGLYLGREHMLASRSRWSELATKYPGSTTAKVEWNACQSLETEIQEGNSITRVSYGRASRPGQSIYAIGWAKMFPRLYVAVNARGLYLKQQPWNFKHPPLLIPWKKILEIRSLSASDHAVGKVARQTGIGADKFKVPKVMTAVLDALGGDQSCIALANPRMTITLPADVIVDASKHLAGTAPAAIAAGSARASAASPPTAGAATPAAALAAKATTPGEAAEQLSGAQSAAKYGYRGRLA